MVVDGTLELSVLSDWFQLKCNTLVSLEKSVRWVVKESRDGSSKALTNSDFS